MGSYSAKQRRESVSMQGAKELAKDLKDMGEGASDILSEAAMAGGNIALIDARINCPVKTGALKNSLKIKVNKVSEVKADVIVDYDKSLYYGTFVELGTKKNKAHPFLRNAVDNNIEAINQAILNAVAKGVDKGLWIKIFYSAYMNI